MLDVGPLHMTRQLMTFSRVTLLACSLFACSAGWPIFAPTALAQQSGPNAEPVQRAATSVPRLADQPTNCEAARLFHDLIVIAARDVPTSKVILIGRLGARERSRSLNTHRLQLLGRALREMGLEVVVAQGDRSTGLGRIEAYVAGKLLHEIVFARNARWVDCRNI